MMKESRKIWTLQQDQAIQSLVKKYGHKKWTIISQKLSEKYPQDGRTGKQCRQRWFNHLSPDIKKEAWTEQELKILFDTHKSFGNKWTQISSKLPGRTDNSIKNQFYSTLRKALRRIYRFLGTNNSTLKIKKIRPITLSLMISHYHEHEIDEDIKEIDIYEVFCQFADQQKYERIKQQQVTSIYKYRLQKILNILVDYKDFNRKKTLKTRKSQHMVIKKQANIIAKCQMANVDIDVGQLQPLINLQFGLQTNNNKGKLKLKRLILDEQIQRLKQKGELPHKYDSDDQMSGQIDEQVSYKYQQQMPLCLRKQNSVLGQLQIKNKNSSLSSQRNMRVHREDEQQNFTNFGFPFEQPLGTLPAFIIKQSYEDQNQRFMDMHEKYSLKKIKQKRRDIHLEAKEKQENNLQKVIAENNRFDDEKVLDIFKGIF